jgi:ribosome-binding factor A
MSYRLEKYASTLQQALAEILNRESLNPDFRLITILRVVPAVDLKRATVFVACPGDRAAGVLEQLERSRGFIKKLLGRKMILRYMPDLDFTLDTALELDEKIRGLRPQGDGGLTAGAKTPGDHEGADR